MVLQWYYSTPHRKCSVANMADLFAKNTNLISYYSQLVLHLPYSQVARRTHGNDRARDQRDAGSMDWPQERDRQRAPAAAGTTPEDERFDDVNYCRLAVRR